MLALTDRPLRAAAIVSSATSWSPCPLASLDATSCSLWRAVGGGDRLYRAVIEPARQRTFWSRLLIIDEAPASQFDGLRELYRTRHAPSRPVACAALTGRGFHGHRGRSWAAARGNLHLSLGLATHLPARQLLPALTMLPAVAVVEAIGHETERALEPGIKWVNDILLRGRKVAGVLATTQTQQGIVESAVLGIGLNVACAPAVPPTIFVPQVTSLAAELGGDVQPISLAAMGEAVLAELATGFERLRRDGPSGLLERYRSASLVVGRRVRVYEEHFGDGPAGAGAAELVAAGRVERIEPDLALRLAERREPVRRGRLAFEEVCQRLHGSPP